MHSPPVMESPISYNLQSRKRRRSIEEEEEEHELNSMFKPRTVPKAFSRDSPNALDSDKSAENVEVEPQINNYHPSSIPLESGESRSHSAAEAFPQTTHEDKLVDKSFEREIIFIHEFFSTEVLHYTSVGFVRNGRNPQPILVNDSLPQLAEKLRRLVDFGTSTRQSLAVVTGQLNSQKLKEFDPVGNAIATIDRLGKEDWEAFCDDLVRGEKGDPALYNVKKFLPHADWSLPIFQLPVGEEAYNGKPPSARVQKTFERRAKALQYLYNDPDISPENAKWFTMKQPFMLPLVKAVDRVLAAIGTMKWGREKAKAMMVQEEITFLKHTVTVAEGILYGIPTSVIEASLSPSRQRCRKTSMVHAEYLLGRKRARMAAEPPTGSRSADGRALWTETHKLVSSYLAILRDRIADLELGRVVVEVHIDDPTNPRKGGKVDVEIQDRAAALMAIDVTKSILLG